MGALHITLIEFRKFVFIAPIAKILHQGANQCQSEEQDDSDFHYSPKNETSNAVGGYTATPTASCATQSSACYTTS